MKRWPTQGADEILVDERERVVYVPSEIESEFRAASLDGRLSEVSPQAYAALLVFGYRVVFVDPPEQPRVSWWRRLWRWARRRA